MGWFSRSWLGALTCLRSVRAGGGGSVGVGQPTHVGGSAGLGAGLGCPQ